MRDRYDVVVVGGGINGVGVAQAAAARGLSVLLLEKQPRLAGGTSSRSSKLIHGGLRYLESGRLGLVAEALRERALLLRLAPELVRLRWFYLPVYETTRRSAWQLRAGLGLYALLGRLRNECRFETVPRREWGSLDGLATGGLKTVLRYRDAQTDDAALTRAVMASACGIGAELLTGARVERVEVDGDGCEVEIDAGGVPRVCRAAVLVNAAGPWACELLRRVRPTPRIPAVELVQGAHLIVAGRVERGVYYVEAPQDGRAVFVMPWGDRTLVGTTETPYRGDPDHVEATSAERAYLAGVLDRYFPRYGATRNGAVRDAFAGLRVLPASSQTPFSRSREAVLETDRRTRPRVLTILGGKLTTYRATAEKVMERIAPSLPRRRRVARTSALPLSPAEP